MHTQDKTPPLTESQLAAIMRKKFWETASKEQLDEMLKILKDVSKQHESRDRFATLFYQYETIKQYPDSQKPMEGFADANQINASKIDANKALYSLIEQISESFIKDLKKPIEKLAQSYIEELIKEKKAPTPEQEKNILDKTSARVERKFMDLLQNDIVETFMKHFSFESSVPKILEEFELELANIFKNPYSLNFQKQLLAFLSVEFSEIDFTDSQKAKLALSDLRRDPTGEYKKSQELNENFLALKKSNDPPEIFQQKLLDFDNKLIAFKSFKESNPIDHKTAKQLEEYYLALRQNNDPQEVYFNDIQNSIIAEEKYKIIENFIKKVQLEASKQSDSNKNLNKSNQSEGSNQSGKAKSPLILYMEEILEALKKELPSYTDTLNDPRKFSPFLFNDKRRHHIHKPKNIKTYELSSPSEERNLMITDVAEEILKAYEKLTENEKEEIQKFCNYGTMNFHHEDKNAWFVKILFQHSNLLLSDETMKVMENMSALELSLLLHNLKELTQEVDKELTQEYYASKINPLSMNDLKNNSQLSNPQAKETLPGEKDERGKPMAKFQERS